MEVHSMRLRRDPRSQNQNSQDHPTSTKNDELQDGKLKSPTSKPTNAIFARMIKGGRWWFPYTRRVLVLLLLLIAMPLKAKLFGKNGSIHGGLLGTLVDSTIRTYTFRKTMKKRNEKLLELGYRLPELTQENINKRGLPVITQSYLADTLLNSAERKRRRIEAERSSNGSKCKSVPPLILQPNSGKWYRPFKVSGEFSLLEFQESERMGFMKMHFPALPENDIQIWGLCALYWYGGYFVSSAIRSSDVLEKTFPIEKNDDCKDMTLLIFRGENVEAIKATPRHPSILCAIRQLEESSGDTPLSINALFFGKEVTHNLAEGQWFENSCLEDQPCCELKVAGDQRGSLFLQNLEAVHGDSSGKGVSANNLESAYTIYNVVERQGHSPQTKNSKTPISARLSSKSCQAGWLCNRCLKTSWFGSFGACSFLCRQCYVDTICKDPDDPKRNVVHIDVVADPQRSLETAGNSRRIPRIVHQTWFEDVTVDRYPHLVRIQNSWKRSGWDYRFYDDDSARKYIHTHFPPRFLDAFDAIVPGAFKADLFRLLLLLREGGIYVDADVKLDINLDVFVTENLGFFAPRDFIGGYDNGCYCFWNGFIGAEPGHPFVAKAVERMLNVVLNRGDYYDLEREICRASPEIGDTEVWKLRALDILTLTGPCALGLSVNGALGRGNLVQTFDTGWFQTDGMDQGLLGDVLLLTPDKYDMGEFRFTDVDRNILVASTEFTMLIKKPLENAEAQPSMKAHYSSQEHISDVFGETGVYVDNFVTNEVHEIHLEKT